MRFWEQASVFADLTELFRRSGTPKRMAGILWYRMTARSRIQRYCSQHSVIKISLGVGDHVRPGWLNTDFLPGRNIVHLNATLPFPLPDSSVDYFHSEHMIEHIPLAAGYSMINECFRALKPGGKLRLVTPDLTKIAKLISAPDDPATVAYAAWAGGQLRARMDRVIPMTPCVIFNNFMHDWGHQFIYDEKTLTMLLDEAGFKSVVRCPIGVSADPNLTALEWHGAVIGDEPNMFESMAVEATKPS
jgi:predicted SAM-dependent methyltransferase